MKNWKNVTLGSVCTVIPGYAFKSCDWRPIGIPVLKIKNISGDGTVNTLDVDCVPSTFLTERIKRFLLQDGDIVLAMTGATAGKVGKLRSSTSFLLNQRVAKLIPTGMDRRFFWSVVSSEEYQNRFFRLADGAAQPNMSGAQIEGVLLPLPSLESQRRIASILGAYDDLIEVNRRRVAVLEEMARGLFEEWFVRFRYPGHETVPLLPTPDGPLPQGWEYEDLGNVATINAASLKASNAPSEIGYIDIASVSPGQIDNITRMLFSEAPGRARRRVVDGSILWSNVRPNRRSYALVLEPTPDTIASTGFTVIDALKISFAYLFQWVSTDSFVGYLEGHATGAAYPAVTASTFERARVVLPSKSLERQYAQFSEPLLRLSDKMRRANSLLAESRDLLLPRLISGQLSVAAAERELEKVA